MLKIFCDKADKPVKNFWNHIVFHPTNAIEDDWGQMYLDKIAEDNAAKTVRLYSMFEECVTLDENGEMQFDFSLNDYRIDSLIKRGFDIMLSYAFFPLWLAADQSERYHKPRYKNKIVPLSRPTDYSKWEKMCLEYTRHITERYGEETVASWHLNCYNEPDLFAFFCDDTEDWQDRAEEYCKIYNCFERAVTSVSEKYRIGGCALSQCPTHELFFEHFLKYVKRAGKRLDFLTTHIYGTSYSLMQQKRVPLQTNGPLVNLLTVRRIADLCGFKEVPMLCDEWGASTSGYNGNDGENWFEFRENELYSAYFAKMITHFDEINAPVDMMMICLSGQHDLEIDFGGHRNFFSKSFYPKPIYNAHVLAARLGETKLSFYATMHDWHLSAFPTRHNDGHLSCLLSYADQYLMLDLPDLTFDVVFDGLDGEYKVTKYVIDKTHANVYTKFLELGSPQNPTEEIKRKIREAGELREEYAGTVSPESNTLSITMENHAVVLLEAYKL